MEKSDLEGLIEAAEAWYQAVLQIKDVVEKGEWDDLERLHRSKDMVVLEYQVLAKNTDISQYSIVSLQPLEALLKAIRDIEQVLIIRLEEYRGYLVDSLKSVRMEGSLQQRYSLDKL